jgi:hypothetical protein
MSRYRLDWPVWKPLVPLAGIREQRQKYFRFDEWEAITGKIAIDVRSATKHIVARGGYVIHEIPQTTRNLGGIKGVKGRTIRRQFPVPRV